jgi:hypothetical protein
VVSRLGQSHPERHRLVASLVLCPPGWLNYQVYCYYNSQTSSTWNNSRAYCQSFGADLLVIKSQDEFDFIKPKAAAIIGAKGLAFIGYYTVSNTTRPYRCSVFFPLTFVSFSWCFRMARSNVEHVHRLARKSAVVVRTAADLQRQQRVHAHRSRLWRAATGRQRRLHERLVVLRVVTVHLQEE